MIERTPDREIDSSLIRINKHAFAFLRDAGLEPHKANRSWKDGIVWKDGDVRTLRAHAYSRWPFVVRLKIDGQLWISQRAAHAVERGGNVTLGGARPCEISVLPDEAERVTEWAALYDPSRSNHEPPVDMTSVEKPNVWGDMQWGYMWSVRAWDAYQERVELVRARRARRARQRRSS